MCFDGCPTPNRQQELLALVKNTLCAGRMAPLARDSDPHDHPLRVEPFPLFIG